MGMRSDDMALFIGSTNSVALEAVSVLSGTLFCSAADGGGRGLG